MGARKWLQASKNYLISLKFELKENQNDKNSNLSRLKGGEVWIIGAIKWLQASKNELCVGVYSL